MVHSTLKLRFRDKHFKKPCLSNLVLEDQFTPMMRVLGRFPPRSLPVPFGDLSPLTTTGPRGPALVTNLGLSTLGNFLGPRSRGCAENPARPAPPARQPRQPRQPRTHPAPRTSRTPRLRTASTCRGRGRPPPRRPHGPRRGTRGPRVAPPARAAPPLRLRAPPRSPGAPSRRPRSPCSRAPSGARSRRRAARLFRPPARRCVCACARSRLRAPVLRCPPAPGEPAACTRALGLRWPQLARRRSLLGSLARPHTGPPLSSNAQGGTLASQLRRLGSWGLLLLQRDFVFELGVVAHALNLPAFAGTEACGYLWVQSQPRLQSETLFLNK